jgi:hypothetical protein
MEGPFMTTGELIKQLKSFQADTTVLFADGDDLKSDVMLYILGQDSQATAILSPVGEDVDKATSQRIG